MSLNSKLSYNFCKINLGVFLQFYSSRPLHIFLYTLTSLNLISEPKNQVFVLRANAL